MKRALVRRFALRHGPAVAAAAVLIAATPPSVTWWISVSDLKDEAAAHAADIARELERQALRQPHLWTYAAHKVIAQTTRHKTPGLASAWLTDCGGDRIAEVEVAGADDGGPGNWAPVSVGGDVVGFVGVTMSDSGLWSGVGRVGLVSTLLSILLAAFLFFYPLRVVQERARTLDAIMGELKQARAELEVTNANLEQRVAAAVDNVRVLSARVVDVSEEERRRIARDLHDSVGQLMTGLDLLLGQIDGPSPQLEEARAVGQQALDELRRVVYDLKPPELDGRPIATVLVEQAEVFERRSGIPTSIRTEGGPFELPDNVAVALLRVLQEALSNVGRHADATEVGVVLKAEGATIRLTVRDDGVGVPDKLVEGAGVVGMKERAELLGGVFTISANDPGTLVEVELPMQARQGGKPT